MGSLTPAEELGLGGSSLDGRIRRIFYSLDSPTILDLLERMEVEALRRGLVYYRHGAAEAIRIMLRPLGAMPEQVTYVHFATLAVQNALKRLPELYRTDPDVRRVVPLTAEEEAWLDQYWSPSLAEQNPVFGRLDATVDFTSPTWKDSLQFFEPNLCGVGGLHYGPTAEQLLADVMLPIMTERDPQLRLEVGRDLREMFIQEVLDHLEAIGRHGRNVCFVEPKLAGEGPEEQQRLAEYYHARHGLKIMHADPAELHLEAGEVRYQGEIVDVAYRDYEIHDLLAIERGGVDIAPLRKLFAENRVISSLSGDFDHKSCWEVFTDPVLAARYFQSEERQVFRRHILWTRLLADRVTSLPDGTQGPLLAFVRNQRELLVLKPNRSYGGDRVTIGQLLSQQAWEQALAAAVADARGWVVQRLAYLPVFDFPVIDSDGLAHLEPFYTVMGFAPTKYGVGIVGRASQKQVVNVAQRGGICAVLLGQPPARLVGPEARAAGVPARANP